MFIKRIELIHLAIPIKKPFETSFGVINERPALVVKMTANDDRIGYGESSPLYVPMSEPEVLTESVTVLKKTLPKIVGFPVEKDLDITKQYSDTRHPVSVIGIEAAYLDLVSQCEGIPLCRLFGATRSRVIAGESVGIQASIEDVIREVEQYVSKGFTRIKVKIAPGKDVEVVRAVREAFPALTLGADANAAYVPSQLPALFALGEFNLSFVEQPFGADEYEAHAGLRRYGVPVCLDETVRDVATCIRAVESGACDMINIKPARIGSFRESKAIHDYCQKNRIALFGGGRLETGIGKTINASFYSLPGFTEPSDITPPLEYFESDVIAPPFSLRNGVYEISSLAGLGISIQEEKVKKYTKERLEFA